MANEAKRVLGSWTTLEASGGSMAANAFAQANDAQLDVSASLPLFVDFMLTITFSTAPSAGEVVNLYARARAIDGTADAQVPSANYLQTYLGSATLENVTSAQNISIPQCVLPAEKCDIYLENKSASGSGASAGWVLKYRTHTIGPA